MAKGLAQLEKHLAAVAAAASADDDNNNKSSSYLVGNQVTLADIVVASTLLYPLKLVADPAYMKPFPTVAKWFITCVQQPEFQQVIGHVTLCQKELKAPKTAWEQCKNFPWKNKKRETIHY